MIEIMNWWNAAPLAVYFVVGYVFTFSAGILLGGAIVVWSTKTFDKIEPMDYNMVKKRPSHSKSSRK